MEETTAAQHHLDRAYELEDQNLYQEALAECDRAVQLDPELAEAYNLRGIILEELERKEEAIAAYQKAVELQPAFEEAIQNLQEAQEEELDTGGEFDAKKAIKGAVHGALGFGISFAIANIVQGLINQFIGDKIVGDDALSKLLQFGLTLVVAAVMYSISIGVGTTVLEKSASGNSQMLVPANALGFGITYLVLGAATQAFFHFNTYLFDSFLGIVRLYTVLDTVKFALPGIVLGLFFGLILRNSRRQLFWSAVAGSAFGLAGLSADLCLDILLSISYSNQTLAMNLNQGYYLPFFGIYYGIQGLIAGGAAGAALGYVQSNSWCTNKTVDGMPG